MWYELNIYTICYVIVAFRLSQWPRTLRRRSAATHLLRLWVRIRTGVWMSEHPSRGVLPAVVHRCEWSRNLGIEKVLTHWGLLRQKKRPSYFQPLISTWSSQIYECIYSRLYWHAVHGCQHLVSAVWCLPRTKLSTAACIVRRTVLLNHTFNKSWLGPDGPAVSPQIRRTSPCPISFCGGSYGVLRMNMFTRAASSCRIYLASVWAVGAIHWSVKLTSYTKEQMDRQ